MTKQALFRVGRVSVYLRSQMWYLRYHEHGVRRQVRAARSRPAARQLAAQVNAQLESGSPVATSFEPMAITELRQRWLDYHEDVLRSSTATINRYRTATDHLLSFVASVRAVKLTSQFRPSHAESFVRYLRQLKVPPNGHQNARKRPLRDKGVKYVLEVCRTLFSFAIKRRHLEPYAVNPFTSIAIDRMPVEDAKPYVDLDVHQERRLLEACDDWQLPIFLTLMLTGMRPGELTHLLLPGDVNMEEGYLFVRNKPDLGWKVKTRNERSIPLMPELTAVLRIAVKDREQGPVFRRRRFNIGSCPPLAGLSREQLQAELARWVEAEEMKLGRCLSRQECERLCRYLWRDMGAIKTDRLRIEFMKLTETIDLPTVTAPKTLRHMFATALQDTNVDPLIRNQLMGHAPGGVGSSNGGLGMTGLYTHTRPETLRRQLENALSGRPAVDVARRWLPKNADR